ncbi:hypothetical protein DBO95_02470 [Yersinia pestis]|nr:hypothetical protein DBO95_02470 [Yersinia pestis]
MNENILNIATQIDCHEIIIAPRAMMLSSNNRFAGKVNALFMPWNSVFFAEYSSARMTFCPNN